MRKYLKDSISPSTIIISLILMIIAMINTGFTMSNNYIETIIAAIFLHFGATGVFAHMIKDLGKSMISR